MQIITNIYSIFDERLAYACLLANQKLTIPYSSIRILISVPFQIIKSGRELLL